MIAALNQRAPAAFLGRHRLYLGDDVVDGGDVDPIIDPIDEPISDPIIVDNPILTAPTPAPFVPYGPPVPSDYVAPPPPGYVYNSDGSLSPIAGTGAGIAVPLTDEPVSVSGLQFPVGTVGIDDNGNPVNGSGQVLTPTGAVNSSISPVGIVTPIAQAAAKIAQLATGTSVPTVYPAPAGAVLPAGAVGVNAQGYPVNAAGQILSATPLTSTSGLSWFTNSTLITGVPNWGVLAGGVVGLALLPSLLSMGKKKR